MLSQELLEKYYLTEKRSSKEISILLKCSEHKVNYWLDKHKIEKRSIGDSIYVKRNPGGKIHSLLISRFR